MHREKKSQNNIKVLDKVVQVLDLLANSAGGVRLTEMAEELGLNKTTALRILQALESHHLATRKGDRSYMLGHRVLWWESCCRRSFEWLAFLQPHLEKLRDLTLETATFNLLVKDRTVHLAQAPSPHVTSARFDLGCEAPLNAGASGKVVLAYLDSEARESFLNKPSLRRLTPRTITDRRRLERELEQCRIQAFAISCGERYPNTSSVAAPVFDRHGKVLGAISVIGPSERMTGSRCKSIAATLLKQVRLLRNQIMGNGAASVKGAAPFYSSKDVRVGKK